MDLMPPLPLSKSASRVPHNSIENKAVFSASHEGYSRCPLFRRVDNGNEAEVVIACAKSKPLEPS